MRNRGFILMYTVLVLSVMVIIAGIFADTVIKEVSISRDEAESLKAFYAADAGIECIRYFTNRYAPTPFDTTQPQRTLNCGVGANFTVPSNGGTPTTGCEDRTYVIPITGFANGSCAEVRVNMTAYDLPLPNGAGTMRVCHQEVISNGRNTCGGGKVVERTRWENMR